MNNIHINMPCNPLSYSIFAVNFVHNLSVLNNTSIKIIPIGTVDLSSYSEPIQKNIQCLIDHDIDADTCLRIFHLEHTEFPKDYKYKMVYSFFELDRIDANAVERANTLTKYIVPSKWAKQVAINSGVKVPIEVITPAVYQPQKMRDRKFSKPVKFLVSGKWEIRKCHDLILEAFEDACNVFDDVELHLRTFNHFSTSKDLEFWHNLVKKNKLAHKIKILPFEGKYENIINSYSDYDVFIGVSRGEGWMYPLMEAMAAGLLCIASDNTAMSEYVTEDNCILVKPTKLTTAYDNKWFFGDGNWSDFSVKDISSSIIKANSFILSNNHQKITNAAIRTADKYNWTKTVNNFSLMLGRSKNDS